MCLKHTLHCWWMSNAQWHLAKGSKKQSMKGRLALSSLAMGTMASLYLSVMDTKTLPETGSFWPAERAALAYALLKSESMPITSPVDLISGPSRVSAPIGKLHLESCFSQEAEEREEEVLALASQTCCTVLHNVTAHQSSVFLPTYDIE